VITWIVRLYERERTRFQDTIADRYDTSESRIAELTKLAFLVKAQQPVETAYAMTSLDPPAPPEDVEPPPPPVTGIKLKGGEEVDFLVGEFDDIVNGADEDQLLREQ